MHASGHIRSRALSPWLRLALLALLLLAFGIRLQELTRQDIWWDEARNIDVALRPFTQIAIAPELDIQPPVYYWLLHAWNGLFGVQMGLAPAQIAWFSRLLSVFAGVVGVALLFPLAKRAAGATFGPTAGLLAVLVGASAAFWLGESQEARMYTLGFALLAAAALVLLRYVAGQASPPAETPAPKRRTPWGTLVAFVVLSTAALLTHYNVVFVLVAWYLWWGVWALLRKDRLRQLAVVFGCGLAMVVLVLPLAPIALRQIPDYANPNITIVSVGEYLFQNWQAYAGGYAFDAALLGGNGLAWLWAVLALAGVGLVALLLPPRAGQGAVRGAAAASAHHVPGIDWPAVLLLGTWLVGSLALYYVAVLDRNAFNVRYASFITPALYALIGLGFAGYARWQRWLPALAAGVLLVGAVPALQADLYDSRFDREHIGEVTNWLRANARPGDVILVDQKYPFGFYYQPYTIDQSAVESPSVEEAAPARYLFVDINTLDRELTQVSGDARRVFWVQWFESDTDPRKAVPFLLDKYGTKAGEQWFQGYSIDWWDLNPPTDFALAPDLKPVQIAFPPAVQTVALSLPTQPLRPGAPLPVVIRWQRTPGGEIARPLKVRVALYDANDSRLVQADERLLNDRHRAPSQWQPADQPLNVYMLPLPGDLPAGTYSVRVLVYDADTLEPLTLVDAAGNAAGQEAELGKIEVRNPQ